MRGKIIQYNGADGSGTLVADGKQYRFALDAWRGDNAPAVNKVVDVSLEGETVSAVTAVGDDVLLKEKASELGGKLGSLLNKIPAQTSSAAGTAAIASGPPTEGSAPGGAIGANSIIERYGKLVLGAYALFLLGTLAFNAISMSMLGQGVGRSLFDIASMMSQLGGSGGGMIKVLLLFAYASIAAPLFWRDRRAWLALSVPLLAVLWAIFSALHAINSIGGGYGEDMGEMFSLGLGFYLSIAAALVLAGAGVKRFLGAA